MRQFIYLNKLEVGGASVAVLVSITQLNTSINNYLLFYLVIFLWFVDVKTIVLSRFARQRYEEDLLTK
jgi:hypothetical protein